MFWSGLFHAPQFQIQEKKQIWQDSLISYIKIHFVYMSDHADKITDSVES